MTIVAVFLLIFAAVGLLLYLLFSQSSGDTKKTLSRLDAIRFGPQSPGMEPDELIVRRAEVFSSLEWLDRLLARFDPARRLRLLLYQADLKWTTGRLLLQSVLIGMISAYLVDARTGAGFLAIFVFFVAGFMSLLYVLRLREKRFYRMKERLPEALDLMVAAIRAGHSFSSAMGMAARECPEPVKREFRQSYDEQNFGLDLRVAMTNLVYRMPIREIRMISTAVLIQKETGGNLTEILDKVSHLIRDDFRLQRQVAVHTAQGRLTGWVLAMLPVFLGIAMYIVNPEHMSVMWKRQIGIYLLEGAVVLTSIGILIIRRIVRVEI